MKYSIDHIKLLTSLKEKGLDETAEYTLSVLKDASDQMMDIQSQQKTLSDKVDHLSETIEEMRDGFPGRDPHGHKAYHEKVMQENINNERLKDKIKGEILQKLFLLLITLAITGLGIKLGFGIII